MDLFTRIGNDFLLSYLLMQLIIIVNSFNIPGPFVWSVFLNKEKQHTGLKKRLSLHILSSEYYSIKCSTLLETVPVSPYSETNETFHWKNHINFFILCSKKFVVFCFIYVKEAIMYVLYQIRFEDG